MAAFIILVAACFLAYSNGANDNFKGVATLFGSGTTNFKKAINWGTITTFAGCLFAIYVAHGLMKNFSGKGLIPDEALSDPALAIAVALGAASTVFLATKIGIPVSTTHAIVGSLVGAGYMAVGNDLNTSMLADTFFKPLLLSPLIACGASIILYFIFKQIRILLKVNKETEIIFENPHTLQSNIAVPHIYVEQKQIETYTGNVVGISAQKILDGLHFISAGAVGFARGMNDAPKIAGLLLLVSFLNVPFMIIIVAVIMAVGGLFNAKKVGETMSKKITYMNPGQGFTSNLITAVLVWSASALALPVSTTHVSVGGIFGIGVVNKKADYKMVGKIVGSWVLTLPIAAVFAGSLFFICSRLI
ncbi:MAG: inorganic phosphate transporter [Chitinophagales bacterium]